MCLERTTPGRPRIVAACAANTSRTGSLGPACLAPSLLPYASGRHQPGSQTNKGPCQIWNYRAFLINHPFHFEQHSSLQSSCLSRSVVLAESCRACQVTFLSLQEAQAAGLHPLSSISDRRCRRGSISVGFMGPLMVRRSTFALVCRPVIKARQTRLFFVDVRSVACAVSGYLIPAYLYGRHGQESPALCVSTTWPGIHNDLHQPLSTPALH